nr:hypothetical protein [Tanacetum cinerariifolium]
MDELFKNKRVLPYGRLLITLFEQVKNENPNEQIQLLECNEAAPIFTDFTTDNIEQTNINFVIPEHGASSFRRTHIDPSKQMEIYINDMFDEDAWNGTEDVISTDEEVDQSTLSFDLRIAFKTYNSTKR